MTDRQQIWAIVVIVVLSLGGYLALDQWVERTGGRSASTLAVADLCIDWAHAGVAARTQAGAEMAAKCESYFRTRSASEAQVDDQRWQQRKQK